MSKLSDQFSVSVRNRVHIPQRRLQSAEVMTEWVTFNNLPDGKEHVAVLYPIKDESLPPLVRLHSECLTGDVFGAQNCDCGAQLEHAKIRMEKEGGALLYLRQEGRGIGLYAKLDAVRIQQETGIDTYKANTILGHGEDERDFAVAANMLKALHIKAVRLITGNPLKEQALIDHGIDVVGVINHMPFDTPHNRAYLAAKRARGHNL
jgi:GTP cyclohydrolase II